MILPDLGGLWPHLSVSADKHLNVNQPAFSAPGLYVQLLRIPLIYTFIIFKTHYLITPIDLYL